MKIGIVTNLYPPYARGGAEVVITRIVTELLALGHNVFIITSRPCGGWRTLWPALEELDPGRVWRFFPLNFYHTTSDFRYPKPLRFFWHVIDAINPLNGLAVGRVLCQERPDVVVTHNLKGLGLTIPSVIRILRLPHVHYVHDVQLVAPSGLIIAGHERCWPFSRLPRRSYALLCRALIGSPNVVIAPSNFLERFYRRRHFFRHSRVIVLPNPAPKTIFLPREQRMNGPLRLLFVGQMVEHKGILFLLKALKSWDLPFELSIAGDGPLKDKVQEIARHDPRLIYVGFAATDQLLRLFQMADLLVVPSLCYENSPTVIYEALQAGLPVAAADIGGTAELIFEGRNGYLFAPGDSQALFSVLTRADQEKEVWFSRTREIQDTVAEYALDRYVRRFLQILHDL